MPTTYAQDVRDLQRMPTDGLIDAPYADEVECTGSICRFCDTHIITVGG